MKLVVNRKELKAALNLLSPATKKKENLITSCVLFDVRGDQVLLRASDRLVYTCLSLSELGGVISVEGDGKFALKEDRLSQWIGNVMEDEITFEVDDQSITLSCGSFESPFAGSDPNLFTAPAIFESQLEVADSLFKAEVGILMEALTFVKPFVASKDNNADPSGKLKSAELREGLLLGTNTVLIGLYLSDQLGDGLQIGQAQMSQIQAFLKGQSADAEVEVLATDTLHFLKITDKVWYGFVRPNHSLPNIAGLPTTLTDDPELWEVEKSSLRSALGALQATAEEGKTEVSARLYGSGEAAILELTMDSLKRGQRAHVDLHVQRTRENSTELKFTLDLNLLFQVLTAYDGKVTMSDLSAQSVMKFYQEQENGAAKICLMSLRHS